MLCVTYQQIQLVSALFFPELIVLLGLVVENGPHVKFLPLSFLIVSHV